MRPLVIGELAAGDPVHVFESQWDAFAFMDNSGERGGIVISRGAGNGALVGGLLPETSTVYLWPQNDAAADKLEKDICANTNAVVKRAKIPAPHKDLNDWTRAGATTDDLFAAMMSAETIRDANKHEVEPEPEPKEDALPEFPVECLPPILERQARAISELCGVPPAMSAPMVLATTSAAIGNGLFVHSLRDITSANLFVLICKSSGSGGSRTFKHATAPFVGRQKQERREFEEEKPQLDAERAVVSTQIDSLKRKVKDAETQSQREQIVEELTKLNAKLAEIEKRVSPILFVTNVTSEKLAEMLSLNGECLAHINGDAGDALDIVTGILYGDGKHTRDSLWLSGFTGDPIVIFRKNSPPIHLDAPCLAVLFLVTPHKVQELFRDTRLTSEGLLPRFLVCDPAARPMPITASADVAHTLPTDVSQPYEAAIFAALSKYRFFAADKQADKPAGEPEPYVIDLTPKARALLIEDWNHAI